MRHLFCLFVVLAITSCASQNSYEKSVNKAEAAKTRVSLGLTYLQNGNYAQAKANLDKALDFAPNMTDVHFAMAYYYQAVGEVSLAEKFYQTALGIDDDNPDLLNSYGAFLCQQGSYALAERYLLKAINTQQYSHTADSYENLAICSQSQAKLPQAIDYLNSALKYEPARSKSMIMLAELYISVDDWIEAKRVLRKLERIASMSPELLLLAIKIESGTGNKDIADGYVKMLKQLYPNTPIPDLSPVTPVKQVKVSPEKTQEKLKQAETKTAKETSDVTKNPMSDKIHVVQYGENLYRISIKYNVRMQRLIEWNNLSSSEDIVAGKKLYIANPNEN